MSGLIGKYLRIDMIIGHAPNVFKLRNIYPGELTQTGKIERISL